MFILYIINELLHIFHAASKDKIGIYELLCKPYLNYLENKYTLIYFPR